MDNPLTDLQQRLADRNLSEVARRCGMAYRTIHRLAGGKRNGIYMDTYRRITAVLDEMDREPQEAATDGL